ncbi:DUF3575 domain-containing protein [uncultured Bacteroides sp.]|uniref:DUF3575 domain-containing protein n=1 Tax=uncultured Bacteroides sp. TaxID=162156 RepID=UPI00280A6BF9|nr:DUF3575 domain-containing protein [uncultured Bacteroides sp.]
MYRKLLYRVLLLCLLTMSSLSLVGQNVAFKTNIFYWGIITPNAGMEFSLSKKVTFELFAAYNPWTFKDNKKMRFWLVQPEVKYWLCEKFEGHFLGMHLHGAQFFGGFKDTRYDGYLSGGGISYGYDWILSPYWNLEVSFGVGYAHLWYDKSPRIYCEKCRIPERKNYFGPTKAAVSLIYTF